MPVLFFVGLICVLIIGGIAFSIWRRRLREKRMMELAMWAEANGFSFRATVDRSMDWRFRDFRCLQRGDDRYGYNVMEGATGRRPVCAFDYHYETHSTGSKGHRQTHHHHMSALVVEASLPLKPLFIRPEGFPTHGGPRPGAARDPAPHVHAEPRRQRLRGMHRRGGAGGRAARVPHRGRAAGAAALHGAVRAVGGVRRRLSRGRRRSARRPWCRGV